MRWLKYLNYTVISMQQAVDGLLGKITLPKHAVVLTFDDGYENFYHYAYPVLKRYGFPAMVYLLSGKIAGTADWFAVEGMDTPALLSEQQIHELQANGIDFGSHGVSHVKFAEVGLIKATQEMTDSKQQLEQLLGKSVDHLCYPFGSHSPEVVEAARQAGYVSAVTCERAAAMPGMDLLQLPRKAVSYGDDLFGFLWKLHMKHEPKQPIPNPTQT
jgi:peptidoglycan/xylan/chitin deacetylase (PgdA/CDA1 family)